jgi:hypothetical protein
LSFMSVCIDMVRLYSFGVIDNCNGIYITCVE